MYSENRAPLVLISLWAMSGVACFFMLLRFYCKFHFGKSFGWDDYVLAISWVLSLLYAAFLSVAARYGMGAHFDEIHGRNVYWLTFWLDHALTCTILSICLSKTSFALTLLRFAPHPWHRYTLWFAIVSVNIAMILVIILQYAQCRPIEKRWDRSLPGTCYSQHATVYYSMASGAYSGFWDFALAILPWTIIWKLQMTKKEKVGVAVAMSMGIMAGVTAVLKVVYAPGMGHWQDYTWECSNLLIWSGAEFMATMVGASIPFLRVLIKRVKSRVTSTPERTPPNSYRLRHIPSGNETGDASGSGWPGDKNAGIPQNDDGSDRSMLGDDQGKEGVIA